MGATALADPGENLANDRVASEDTLPNDTAAPAIQDSASATQSDEQSSASTEKLQSAVLQALADGNQRILVSMLEGGKWSVEKNDVLVRIVESQTVVDMSFGAEARRLAVASASGVLGRAVKFRIVPDASVTPTERRNGGSTADSSSRETGRSRAENDTVVRRLQEKFGAQIRTVIDYKEKR
jgi:hypothetical protein